MNLHFNRKSLSIRILALAALAAIGSTASARSFELQFDSACSPVLSGLDQRLYQRAVQDTGELRRFITSRRAIYALDVGEAADWAAGVNAARADCLRRHTQARAEQAQAR
jgi:hypothetical protein